MLEWAARLRREMVEPASIHHPVAEAYRTHLEPIYRMIYRKVGNREAAEDLTADVFVKALHGLDGERSSQAIQGWLYATARTTIADYWRRQVRNTVDITELEEILTGDTDAEDATTGTTEAESSVAGILAALPERDRAVLTMRFLQGYSVAEAARALGVNEGHLKVLQYRALKRAAGLRRDHHGRH